MIKICAYIKGLQKIPWNFFGCTSSVHLLRAKPYIQPKIHRQELEADAIPLRARINDITSNTIYIKVILFAR